MPQDPQVQLSSGPTRVQVGREADPEFKAPAPVGFTAQLPGCDHYGHWWKPVHPEGRKPGAQQPCRCVRCNGTSFATPTEGLAP